MPIGLLILRMSSRSESLLLLNHIADVGDNTKGPRPTAARLDAKVRFAVDVEAHAVPTTEPTKQDQRAPIKMVTKRAWSSGIYQALRLTGEKPRCSMGEGVYSPSHF